MNNYRKILIAILFLVYPSSYSIAPVYAQNETAVIAIKGDFDSLKMATASNSNALQVINNILFMTLFKLNKDLDFEPRLAESWTVNSDSTLLTLVLRDDIKWSDGEKTTAKDVEFTVRIATHPQVPYPASSRFDRIQSVQALNDTTVQVKLESWYPDLFFDLNIPVLPEHILAAIPAAQIAQSEFNTQPVGNGPYKLKEWKANQHISFERNEYWPLKQPALSGIVFTILQDDMLLLSNLKNGHIHLAPHLNQTVFNQIKRIPSIRAVRSRSKSYSFIGWNCSQDRFEQKIRLALSRAINKKQIIDICLAGYAKPFRGPFLPESRYYNPELSGIPYNPNKAKQILVDEGWQDSNGDGILEKNNRPFELVLTINAASQLQKDIATVIQSQLSQIGLEVSIQPLEINAFLKSVFRDHNFDAVLLTWDTDFTVDPFSLFHSKSIQGGYNFVGFANSKIDSLLDKAKTVSSAENAQPLWDKFQKTILDQSPYTFLYIPDHLSAVNHNLTNTSIDIRGFLNNSHEWQ